MSASQIRRLLINILTPYAEYPFQSSCDTEVILAVNSYFSGEIIDKVVGEFLYRQYMKDELFIRKWNIRLKHRVCIGGLM